MRITNELKAKIDRGLDAKYNPLINAERERHSALVEARVPEIVQELTIMEAEQPMVKTLIDCIKWKSGYRDTIEKFVRYNLNIFMPAEYQENYDTYQKLSAQKRLDYETLAITISYQKDINDIIEAFAAMGLTF